LRLLANDAGAITLTGLRRFADPAEAAATLRLRRGDPASLDFYEHTGRIRSGTRETLLENAYEAWRADVADGRVAVMVAASNDAAGQVEAGGVPIRDSNRAGVGDWVVTRRNQRTLGLFGGRDFVKNGDVWTVSARHADCSLFVKHHAHGGRVRLPAAYVAQHLTLAYATTAHRAQGTTVDVAHALVDSATTRETLYVAATRARHATILYVVTEKDPDMEPHLRYGSPLTARHVLEQALTQESAEKSATQTIRDAQEVAAKLRAAVEQLKPRTGPTTPQRSFTRIAAVNQSRDLNRYKKGNQ
jgi:hypothetical protein